MKRNLKLKKLIIIKIILNFLLISLRYKVWIIEKCELFLCVLCVKSERTWNFSNIDFPFVLKPFCLNEIYIFLFKFFFCFLVREPFHKFYYTVLLFSSKECLVAFITRLNGACPSCLTAYLKIKKTKGIKTIHIYI